MIKKTLILIIATFALLVYAQEDSPVAEAPSQPQTPSDSKPELIYPDKNRKIQLNFTDELVQGHYSTPDSMFMDSKKGAVMKKLIRLRENFNSNMEKSKNEFKSR